MHKIEYFLFSFIRFIILKLSLQQAQRFGSCIGNMLYYLLRSRRAIAMENLHSAFPEKSKSEIIQIAKGSFKNFGISMAELLWFPKLNDDWLTKLIKSDDIQKVNRAHTKGKGLIVLSGHFGNWELIASGIARLSHTPFTIVVQRQSNKLVDDVINKHRIREILTTLQNGGVIALAPDQSAPKEGVYVEFFGRSVPTHQGPAVFALRCRSPILIGFLIRQSDGSYNCVIEEIAYSDIKGYDSEAVKILTQRHTACLEKYIRLYPDHWLWMHRRWKHVRE